MRLQTYIGTKIIEAEPMIRKEYEALFNQQVNSSDEEGYHVIYPNPKGDYHSWSPKDVFDAAYRQIHPAEQDIMINNRRGE